MANYYQKTEVLNVPGYEIYFTRFADSILNDHFNDAKDDLLDILQNFVINERLVS